MKAMITTSLRAAVAAVAVLVAAPFAPAVAGGDEGHAIHIERQPWSFAGFRGQFDAAQLQRGFQVYEKVCSSCHGLKRVRFRNLSEPGGPEFPIDGVKALAAGWGNKIVDGPDDNGKMFERPPLPSDPILGPYKNDNEARSIHNGALPPDLSLVAKARNVEYTGTVFGHPLYMLKDILTGYQEGGADYLYALLTGYKPAPADFKLSDGMHYNAAFPGHQIGMIPPPLGKDSPAEYANKALQTAEQQSRDVAAFLAWAADPSLNERKRIGWQAMLYLLITTLLLYLGKKRIWKDAH